MATPSKTFRALEKLRLTFASVDEQLISKAGVPLTYHLVSWRESKGANEAISRWLKEGSGGRPPAFSINEVRAQIYSFGRAAVEVQACRAVFLTTCRSLLSAAMPGVKSGELTIPLTLTRSLVERVATARVLVAAISPIMQKPASNHKELFLNIADVGNEAIKALHGTKMNWAALAESDLRAVKKRDATYMPTPLAVDLSAKQILDSIDELDKHSPGVRISYEILCEFLHPNVGDMFASTIDAGSYEDSFGMKHLEITLGSGRASFGSAPDLDQVVSQAITILGSAITLIPSLERSLKDMAERTLWRTQKLMKPLLRQHRQLFAATDQCPCGSNRIISICCGK